MEKKLTQRTIGLLVIIGFVIILMPLIFTKNESTAKKITNNKTIIEEKSNVATADANNVAVEITPDAADSTNVKPIEQAQVQSQTDKQLKTQEQPTAKSLSQVAQSASSKDEHNAVEKENKTSTLIPEQPQPQFSIISKQSVASEPAEKSKQLVNHAHITKAIHKTTQAKVKPIIRANLAQHSVNAKHAKLKSPAWVVQLGSFNNKTNARQLTDRLRIAGFKAFTREIKSARGKLNTRVYVGPEFKQASAMQLSAKLEQKMKLHGIVLSYKPLDL